jgi:hypothetical protein
MQQREEESKRGLKDNNLKIQTTKTEKKKKKKKKNTWASLDQVATLSHLVKIHSKQILSEQVLSEQVHSE